MNLGPQSKKLLRKFPVRVMTTHSIERMCRKERSEAVQIASKQIELLLEECYHLRNLVNSDKNLQKILRKKK